MKGKGIVTRFKEVVHIGGDDYVEVPRGESLSRKEAYVCKRMKMSASQLREMCYSVGVDAMYDELRAKGGAR